MKSSWKDQTIRNNRDKNIIIKYNSKISCIVNNSKIEYISHVLMGYKHNINIV